MKYYKSKKNINSLHLKLEHRFRFPVQQRPSHFLLFSHRSPFEPHWPTDQTHLPPKSPEPVPLGLLRIPGSEPEFELHKPPGNTQFDHTPAEPGSGKPSNRTEDRPWAGDNMEDRPATFECSGPRKGHLGPHTSVADPHPESGSVAAESSSGRSCTRGLKELNPPEFVGRNSHNRRFAERLGFAGPRLCPEEGSDRSKGRAGAAEQRSSRVGRSCTEAVAGLVRANFQRKGKPIGNSYSYHLGSQCVSEGRKQGTFEIDN